MNIFNLSIKEIFNNIVLLDDIKYDFFSISGEKHYSIELEDFFFIKTKISLNKQNEIEFILFFDNLLITKGILQISLDEKYGVLIKKIKEIIKKTIIDNIPQLFKNSTLIEKTEFTRRVTFENKVVGNFSYLILHYYFYLKITDKSSLCEEEIEFLNAFSIYFNKFNIIDIEKVDDDYMIFFNV